MTCLKGSDIMCVRKDEKQNLEKKMTIEKKLDYYNRELKINDRVNLDHQHIGASLGRVVGFTAQKVKVYNVHQDKIQNIKPSNITKIGE